MINGSNNAADSTCFIEFMLSAVKSALLEITDGNYATPNKKNRSQAREQMILACLSEHGDISNSDVRELLSVSSATANRVLNDMSDRGLIIRFRKGKSWAYKKK